jgi:cytochrome c-type biogenesis protein CcmH
MASRIPFALIGPRALSAKAVSTSLLALFFIFLFAIVGCIREEDITLEQRAHQLSGELMCPICDGQTIDGSNAQIAQDMRAKVRERLDAGDTNAEVKDYFVLRYGQEILAAPKRSGFSLLAWIVPVIIVLGAIGIALFAIKNMRKGTLQPQLANSPSAAGAATTSEEDLADYLAQVDRDLDASSRQNLDDNETDKPAPSDEAKT